MTQTIEQRYNITMRGSGTQTLIFAHGFGSDQTAWRHQVSALEDDYRIVLFDLPGSGGSDPESYSPYRHRQLDGYVEDFITICQTFDLQDSIFIGHSVSGMIGILTALFDPGLFRQIILLGASPRYLNDDDGYIGGFEQSDLDALYENMSTNYSAWVSGFAPFVMDNPERPELGHEFARTLSAMRPDIALSTARAIFQSDHRAALKKLTIPVLIVQSEQDVAVPVAVGEFMQRQIPNSQLVILPTSGHLPHLSAPAQVTAQIRQYLKQESVH